MKIYKIQEVSSSAKMNDVEITAEMKLLWPYINYQYQLLLRQLRMFAVQTPLCGGRQDGLFSRETGLNGAMTSLRARLRSGDATQRFLIIVWCPPRVRCCAALRMRCNLFHRSSLN